MAQEPLDASATWDLPDVGAATFCTQSLVAVDILFLTDGLRAFEPIIGAN